MTYYKATRPDGTDFRTGTINYAAALESGAVIRHPSSQKMVPNRAATYLSVSVAPAETLIGGEWPCRLFRVEPEGETLAALEASAHKRACLALRVVEELPAHDALGPNGARVAAIIEHAKRLTPAEATQLYAAGNAAWDAAWYAARDAARRAALAENAALAELVRDLITPERYAILAGPWNSVIGETP